MKRWFALGEATEVEHVMIVMTNFAGETVVEDVVDVDYRVG